MCTKFHAFRVYKNFFLYDILSITVMRLKVKFTEVLDLVQHREVIVKGVSVIHSLPDSPIG